MRGCRRIATYKAIRVRRNGIPIRVDLLPSYRAPRLALQVCECPTSSETASADVTIEVLIGAVTAHV